MSIEMRQWQPPDIGGLFVVTGPSGCGKTTLVKAARNNIEDLDFSVSATTRDIRKGEQDGVDYLFVTEDDFKSKIKDGQFLEWAKVYSNYYGTPHAQIQSALSKGLSIILDIDAQGAAQVRSAPIEEVSIFILPPNTDSLRKRLESRGTDSPETIDRRMREAKDQMKAAVDFDYVIVNDDLETAINQFQAIIFAELLKVKRRKKWMNRI